MLKIVLMAIIIVASLSLTSCVEDSCVTGNSVYDNREYTVTNFQNVRNPFSGNVKLKYGSPKVIVRAETNIFDLLTVKVDNSTLRFGTVENKCFNSNGMDFEISSNDFKQLTNNGSANWTSDSIYINPSISSNGSGNIKLTGRSVMQNVESSGSGDVDLWTMPTDSAYAKGNGSGKIILNARKFCDIIINGSGNVTVDSVYGVLIVEINGSGNLYYSGNPVTLDVQRNGSGRVIKR